jgi:hypothetical protein
MIFIASALRPLRETHVQQHLFELGDEHTPTKWWHDSGEAAELI